MYHINRSQVEKHCMETSVCLFSFFIHCSFVPNTIATEQHLHIQCRISYIGVESICTRMFTDICMSKYVFIADQAVQGKLKYGLLSDFFWCLLNTKLVFISKLLGRHKIKLGYKIKDKRTQLFKTSLPFFLPIA